MKHLLLSTTLLALLAPTTLAAEPLVDLLRASCRITDGKESGTAFFVRLDGDAEPPKIVAVTAAHAFEKMPGKSCRLFLRQPDGEQGYRRKSVEVPIRDGKKTLWTRHPKQDVAVLPVALPEEVDATSFALEQIADAEGPAQFTVGAVVWIACFPAAAASNDAGWPILRSGTVATYPVRPVDKQPKFMVDATAFGGDSGAPVVLIVDGRPIVVGAVHGMLRQTNRTTSPFEETVRHMPMDLSIITQAAFVRETIDSME